MGSFEKMKKKMHRFGGQVEKMYFLEVDPQIMYFKKYHVQKMHLGFICLRAPDEAGGKDVPFWLKLKLSQTAY